MHNALTICKKMKIEKKEKLIFNFFLIFYLVLGIQLTFNYNFINTMNLLFDADTARVINDISTILINHYRLSVHPLFVIIMQPIYFIIKGITQNKMLALVIISSIVSALSVAIVYKIISLYCNKEKINILLSMCYGFTFASFMFTGGIEVYNISALALLFLWYFIAKKLKGEWKKGDLFILSFLGLLSLSIVITNYVVFLIGCLVLLISKKVDFKDLFCINIIIRVVIT